MPLYLIADIPRQRFFDIHPDIHITCTMAFSDKGIFMFLSGEYVNVSVISLCDFKELISENFQ